MKGRSDAVEKPCPPDLFIKKDKAMAWEKELEVVLEAVEEAGKMLLQETERKDGIRGKGDKAAVDDEIDAYLRGVFHRAFPKDTILSEEGGEICGTSGRFFWIDPHDGTRDFLLGRRETSISVALLEDDHFALGVIHAPFSTELTGKDGLFLSCREGRFLQNHRQRAEKKANQKEEERELSSEDRILITTRLRGEALEKNREAFFPARLEFCASIATRLALVALGEASMGLTIHTLSGWDIAGGQALLQAAGGNLFDQELLPILWKQGHPVRKSCAYFGVRKYDTLLQLTPALRKYLLS
jgi:myo-inositol-1(or 4)-monophosphatase